MDTSDASVLLHYGGVSRMSLDRNPIRTIEGEAVGWLHEAPPLLVDMAIAALREVDDLPPDELLEGVAEASRLFGCDDLEDAVAEGGGLRCMNISAVYTPDPATVADALAHRLSRLPVLHPTDQNAVLPGVLMADASAVDTMIRRYGPSVRDHSAPLYDDRTIEQVGPDSAVLRPRVLSVSTPTHPLIGTEHRFPFVVLAPWPAEAPVRVRMRLLRDTLVAVLLDNDEDLSRAALSDTSIRKVVIGPTAPWWTSPSLPHEGLLTQFLFDGKTLLTRPGAA